MKRKTQKINPYDVWTAKVTYVNLSKIYEPVGLNGGDTDMTRWDLDIPAVRKVYDQLKKSILKNGFLGSVVGVKLPHDVDLFETRYTKGSWIALDVNGRIRILKDLKDLGGMLNRGMGKDMEGKLPVADVTHIVLKESNNKINEDVIEILWSALVILNGTKLKWTDYDFISTGSRAIQNTEQKIVWEYLTTQMKKYHPHLSNKVVLGATINALTEKMRTEAKIPFDMKFVRYSEEILKILDEIRTKHGSEYAKAPYLTLVAKYLLKSTLEGRFKGENFDNLGKVTHTHSCFPISGKLYSDSHFFEFKRYITYIGDRLVGDTPPKEGFPGGSIKFKHHIGESMLIWDKIYFKKTKKSA